MYLALIVPKPCAINQTVGLLLDVTQHLSHHPHLNTIPCSKKEMSVAEIMALTGFASRYSFYKYVVHAGSDALKARHEEKKTEGRENESREKR
jgi:hypothetical protein